jgi:hypothetical protein
MLQGAQLLSRVAEDSVKAFEQITESFLKNGYFFYHFPYLLVDRQAVI